MERRIEVLSDSTGETAERVTRAAMQQFPRSRARIHVHSRIRTKAEAGAVLERAAREGAVVVFTVVSSELREHIHALSQELHVDALDVIGPHIHRLGTFFAEEPANTPGLTLPLSDEYFRRVEAVEFAVKTDDGKDPRNLKRADLILLGVSRTSKTSLSTFLAHRGLKVANLQLLPGVRPPRELFEAPQNRVVGLTIDVDHLVEIRKARLRQLGMPMDADYGLGEQVRHELEHASQLFAENPAWPVVDVTGRAIEETASMILGVVRLSV